MDAEFDTWWNKQPISKVTADNMTLIVQSYKDIAKEAWLAGKEQAKSDQVDVDAYTVLGTSL